MRNFSANPDKPTFMEEAPAFVRFFVDPARPKALRVGAGVIAVILFVFPLFAANSTRPSAESTKNMPPEKSTSPKEPALVPAAGEENSAAVAPLAASEAVSTETRLTEEPPVAPAKEIEFTQLPGLFPVPVGILAGKAGSIWISTVQEVSEFRGLSGAKKLDHASYEGLFNDDMSPITTSMVDDKRQVWIGTLNGQIMRYADYDWKIIWKSNEPIKDRIAALIRRDETLFIGTERGLWKWDMSTGKLSRFKGFTDNSINAFLQTPDNQLFLAAKDGAWQLTDAGWKQVVPLHTDRGALTLAYSENGKLWIGTDEGIVAYSIKDQRQQKMASTSAVLSLAAGPDETLWAGVQDGGIHYFDGKQWYAASEPEGLPGDTVSELLEQASPDSAGMMWLGVPGKGVYSAPLSSLLKWIVKYPHEDAPVDEMAPRIYKNACLAAAAELKKTAESGDISVAGSGESAMVFFRGHQVCPSGIGYRTAGGHFVVIHNSQLISGTVDGTAAIPLPDNFQLAAVKKIFADSKGRIWLAAPSGVLMFANDKWTDYATDPALSNNTVQAFLEDQEGGVWIGTAPAFDPSTRSYSQPPLHRFDGQSWTHFSVSDGLPGWTVSALLPLRNGNIVVGTPTGFAFITDKGIVPGSPEKGFRPGAVMSLNEDEDGRLWYGHLFFQKGLSWYDGKELSEISASGKLFSDNVANLVHDGHDKLWLMNSSGQIGVYAKEALMSMRDEPDDSPKAGRE